MISFWLFWLDFDSTVLEPNVQRQRETFQNFFRVESGERQICPMTQWKDGFDGHLNPHNLLWLKYYISNDLARYCTECHDVLNEVVCTPKPSTYQSYCHCFSSQEKIFHLVFLIFLIWSKSDTMPYYLILIMLRTNAYHIEYSISYHMLN